MNRREAFKAALGVAVAAPLAAKVGAEEFAGVKTFHVPTAFRLQEGQDELGRLLAEMHRAELAFLRSLRKP